MNIAFSAGIFVGFVLGAAYARWWLFRHEIRHYQDAIIRIHAEQ